MICFSEITDEYFTLVDVVFDENDDTAFSDREIKWSELKTANLTKNDMDLVLVMNTNEQIIIPADTSGIVSFFKYLPEQLNNPEQKIKIENIYKSLTSCKVCGSIAVYMNQCSVCHSDLELVNDEDPAIELENIKEEQLALYATYEEGEEIDWEFNIDPNYKRNPDWKLLVNEKEILDYSRENCWEEI
jgi:hypothetical protein